MRLLQRGHHGHHGCDNAGTLRALGPKAPLAPEHAWPHGPLGGVVRGFHPVVTDECPQGLPPRQDGPAGALRRGHPTRLTRFPQPLHVAPDRPPIPSNDWVRDGAGSRSLGAERSTGAATTCASLAAAAPSRAARSPPSAGRWLPTLSPGPQGYRYRPGPPWGSHPTALGRTDAQSS